MPRPAATLLIVAAIVMVETVPVMSRTGPV
jgi:hypothetical protein